MNTRANTHRKANPLTPSIDATLVLTAHRRPTIVIPLGEFGRGDVSTGQVVALVHEHSPLWPGERQLRVMRPTRRTDLARAGYQWGFDDPEANGEFTFTSLGLYAVTGITANLETRCFTATLTAIEGTRP